MKRINCVSPVNCRKNKDDMKKIEILFSLLLIGLLGSTVFNGCEEVADLSIDPVEPQEDFVFSPEAGAPGSIVEITGSNLEGVENVAFGTAEASVVSKSDNQIDVEVPVKANSAKIHLSFGNKIYSSVSTFTVLDTPVPAISDFSPLEASRGENVTITGTLLDEVKRVEVGDLEATIVSQSAEEIVFTAPNEFTTAPIYLFYDYTTTYGMVKETSTSSSTDLSLKLPSISGVLPRNTELNIGENITIEGSNLELVNVIHFGDVAVTSEEFDYADGKIEVEVPEGATSGTLSLEATDGENEQEVTFSVDLPSISSFTPEKGEPMSDTDRTFSVLGSKFELVDSVKVGETKGEIISISDSQILFSVDGAVNGTVDLYSSNGVVSSSTPFAFVGEFWVNDWDTDFDVVRFSHLQNNNMPVFETEVMTGETGNYAQVSFGGTFDGNKSFYLFGPNDTGNDDWFTLFVSNPLGVYLEFDIKVSSIDASLVQEDGTLPFKPFLLDSKGWGASGEYAYGYNGPTTSLQTDGEWQHLKLHLEDFVASGNDGLYTVDQVEGTEGAYCHPNSLRIITFIFGTPADSAGNGVIGLDNVKFTIE